MSAVSTCGGTSRTACTAARSAGRGAGLVRGAPAARRGRPRAGRTADRSADHTGPGARTTTSSSRTPACRAAMPGSSGPTRDSGSRTWTRSTARRSKTEPARRFRAAVRRQPKCRSVTSGWCSSSRVTPAGSARAPWWSAPSSPIPAAAPKEDGPGGDRPAHRAGAPTRRLGAQAGATGRDETDWVLSNTRTGAYLRLDEREVFLWNADRRREHRAGPAVRLRGPLR